MAELPVVTATTNQASAIATSPAMATYRPRLEPLDGFGATREVPSVVTVVTAQACASVAAGHFAGTARSAASDE